MLDSLKAAAKVFQKYQNTGNDIIEFTRNHVVLIAYDNNCKAH